MNKKNSKAKRLKIIKKAKKSKTNESIKKDNNLKTKAKKRLINPSANQNISVVLSVISLIFSGIAIVFTGATYFNEYSVSADLKCTAIKDVNILQGRGENFFSIDVICNITNFGSRSFQVKEVYPVMFWSGEPLSGRSNKDVDPNYEKHRKRYLPSEAIYSVPSTVEPRSTLEIKSKVLIPLFFYDEKSSLVEDKKKTEKMIECITEAVDNLYQKQECFSSIAKMSIVEYLYLGAKYPVAHVGYGKVNGVGIKAILYSKKGLIDEIDIREFYGWPIDINNYIENLGESKQFDQMIN